MCPFAHGEHERRTRECSEDRLEFRLCKQRRLEFEPENRNRQQRRRQQQQQQRAGAPPPENPCERAIAKVEFLALGLAAGRCDVDCCLRALQGPSDGAVLRLLPDSATLRSLFEGLQRRKLTCDDVVFDVCTHISSLG